MSRQAQALNSPASLEEISAAVEKLSRIEPELGGALRSAEARNRQRDEIIEKALEQITDDSNRQRPEAKGRAPLNPLNYARPLDYSRLIARIRQAAQEHTASNSVVLVASKGDVELLKLPGRTGWHFPQNELGVYAGYYPATGAAAITHLEALKIKGAQYLLFPGTAFWWFDYYPEFRDHLYALYRKRWQDDDCAIFEFSPIPQVRASRWPDLRRRTPAG